MDVKKDRGFDVERSQAAMKGIAGGGGGGGGEEDRTEPHQPYWGAERVSNEGWGRGEGHGGKGRG